MIPNWKLERFLTGDLPNKEMQEIQTLEKKDTFLKRRIQELRENNKVILEELPFENLVEKLPKTKKQWNFNFGKLAIAAVFILALNIGRSGTSPTTRNRSSLTICLRARLRNIMSFMP